ncbi:MAG: hypothetical protein QNJ44_14715 [Rhodobacter sp.]|nr:hypothetical protein [Rhodobacter sp.]
MDIFYTHISSPLRRKMCTVYLLNEFDDNIKTGVPYRLQPDECHEQIGSVIAEAASVLSLYRTTNVSNRHNDAFVEELRTGNPIFVEEDSALAAFAELTAGLVIDNGQIKTPRAAFNIHRTLLLDIVLAGAKAIDIGTRQELTIDRMIVDSSGHVVVAVAVTDTGFNRFLPISNLLYTDDDESSARTFYYSDFGDGNRLGLLSIVGVDGGVDYAKELLLQLIREVRFLISEPEVFANLGLGTIDQGAVRTSIIKNTKSQIALIRAVDAGFQIPEVLRPFE